MSRFGGGTEVCWVCSKGVYFSDPKINLGGNIHKACCKCVDCGLKLTSQDAIVTKHGASKVIVCPTHNKTRLKSHNIVDAPAATVMDAPDTDFIQEALARGGVLGGAGRAPHFPPASQ